MSIHGDVVKEAAKTVPFHFKTGSLILGFLTKLFQHLFALITML